jgi:hypothetical protein
MGEQRIEPHRDPEWEVVRQTARKLFKVGANSKDLTPADIEVWRLTFPEVGPDGFRSALGLLARSGATWMPVAGELAPFMPKPESAVDAAPFAEVLSAIDGARFLGRAGGVQRMRERTGELGAAFLCAVGVDALKQTNLGGEYGEIAQRDLERRWNEFVASAEADVRRGLPAPRASERGELESRPRGLRRLDFGAVAPVGKLERGDAA